MQLWKPAGWMFFVLVMAQAAMAQQLSLKGLPGELTWRNTPVASYIEDGDKLSISSGKKTDWFVDPFDGTVAKTAPILWFIPAGDYVLSTKAEVEFHTKWDAGALMLWGDDHHWAKLSFEMSPEGQPTMVTVVTRGVSDDCNSIPISGNAVYLQIAKSGIAYVFYASTNGRDWKILRTFSMDTRSPLSVGFESQSPAGEGSKAVFSEINYAAKKIANVYSGK
jgi:regulation of enolase protein 1 (concanavalin A-like superfamily)